MVTLFQWSGNTLTIWSNACRSPYRHSFSLHGLFLRQLLKVPSSLRAVIVQDAVFHILVMCGILNVNAQVSCKIKLQCVMPEILFNCEQLANCQQLWNNLFTACNKLDGSNRRVTRLTEKDLL